MKDFLSGLVGVIVGVIVLAWWVNFGYTKWDEKVQAARHPAGWVTRTATATSVSDSYYNVRDYQTGNIDPPVVRADLRYRDYQNARHDVKINMTPDTIRPGNHVTLYVRNDESLAVPSSVDWNNQVSQYAAIPGGSANHENWPWTGFVLGIICGIILGIVAMFCAEIALEKAPSIKGRLGTR